MIGTVGKRKQFANGKSTGGVGGMRIGERKVRWERMKQRGKEAGEKERTTKDGRSGCEGIGVRSCTEE